MKLGIVIPLKAKSVSRNWEATTTALHRTLCSVRQQSQTSYEAIVIGHDRPQFMDEFKPNITFAATTNPAPKLTTASEFSKNKSPFIFDKNFKIFRGVQILQERTVTHWYTLDADDLLCENFVATLAADGCKNGAVLDGGYLVYPRIRRYIACSELSQYCGSTSVLTAEQVKITKDATTPTTSHCAWFRYPHMKMHSYFKDELDIPYTSFSDPIVGYVLGHGDNCSDGYRTNPFNRLRSKLKPWLKGKPIDNQLAQNLSL